jgi:hypothetical protein
MTQKSRMLTGGKNQKSRIVEISSQNNLFQVPADTTQSRMFLGRKSDMYTIVEISPHTNSGAKFCFLPVGSNMNQSWRICGHISVCRGGQSYFKN